MTYKASAAAEEADKKGSAIKSGGLDIESVEEEGEKKYGEEEEEEEEEEERRK